MKNNIKFKETNISWVGVIPIDWNLIKAKYLFNQTKEINYDLKCKNLLSLTYDGVLNKDYYANEGLRPENYNTYQIFDKDDLVFKMIDLENVKTSRVGIVHEYGIMSSAYIRFAPIKDKIYPKFTYWFFYDLYKKEIYNSLGSGVRSTLSSHDMSEFEIPLPRVEEQVIISNYLDKKTIEIDLLIKKIEKKIELLKEKKNSLIKEVVTKGLNSKITNKESGVEWIKKVPKHWKILKLKYIAKITYGISPSEETYNYNEEGTVLVNGPSEYSVAEFGFTRSIKWTTDPKKIVPKGCLLFCVRASVGKMNIAHQDLSIGRGVCAIEANMDQDYLVYSMMVVSLYIKDKISGSVFPSVTKDDVDNFIIPNPPLEEQKKISEFLTFQVSKINKNCELHLKQINLLKEYRLTLISSVISGKVKVSEK